MLLALDISTSVIGWSIWKNGKLQEQGFIKLANSKGEPKNLYDRLDIAIEELKNFTGITKIAAEEAFQKFSGQTTANTISKLTAMNFGVTYVLSRFWNAEVKLISVNKARSKCGIKVPRQPKGSKKDPNWTKKHVVMEVAKKYPEIKFDLTPSGNPKKGIDDMADAIVIGLAAI